MAFIVDKEGGLDLANPESWTAEEEQAFHDFYLWYKQMTMPGHDFWARYRPDVLKRYRVQAIVMSLPPEGNFSKIGTLCWLHYYAIVGYGEGVIYQIKNAQIRGGAQKKEILATLAVAFLQAGPLGMSSVAKSVGDYLDSYQDPNPTPWPEGWSADSDALRSGLDFSVPELLDGELELLESWYERVCGEVPDYLRLLASCNPLVLKAHRHRYEYAAKDDLPIQMVPLLQLQREIIRGGAPGIREQVLICKGLGVPRTYINSCISRAFIYSGTGALSTVQKAAGDILASWA